MIHIMVDNMTPTIDLIIANGCEIVQPVGANLPAITATQYTRPLSALTYN